MAEIPDVASTVLMGLLLVAVAVAVAYGREWRTYSPFGGDDDAFTTISKATASPTTWIVSFLLLVLGFGGTTLLYVTSSGTTQELALVALGALIGIALAFFLFMGVYRSVRGHGRSTAEAVGAGAWALGLLLVVAIAAKLIAA